MEVVLYMSAVIQKKPLAGIPPSQAVSTAAAWLYGIALVAFVFLGWATRQQSPLTPKEGLGYILGIMGGSSILLLLLYPLRKYARWMRHIGPVRHWFRAHMFLGVLGPVLILFHANFSTGALNSNLTLFAMLVVASSGLFGRFIYTRIHHGLYGSRATLASLSIALEADRDELNHAMALNDTIRRRLAAHERLALKPRTPLTGILALPLLLLHRLLTRLHVRSELRLQIADQACTLNWDRSTCRKVRRETSRIINHYLDIVGKCAGFQAHERLFSLWHLLHLPLFAVLVISGIVHVFAVHLY
jgi:hypothetical protein